MARARDKDRLGGGAASAGDPVADDAKGKGEGTKRQLAAIATTLEDIVYGQELMLAKIGSLAEQLADQKQLIKKLAGGAGQAEKETKGQDTPAKVFSSIVPELHNAASGRLDAKRVADSFGLTLSLLARVLGRNLSTVSKTPDADALQDRLAAFERIATALLSLGWPLDQLRIWAKTPGPLWDGRSPEEFIAEGLAVAVAQRLEDSIQEGAD